MTTMKENEMKIPMKVPMNDYEILTSLGNLENLNLNQTQVTKLQTCNFYNNSAYKLICKIYEDTFKKFNFCLIYKSFCWFYRLCTGL